jgi:hypothetical protein
VSAIGEIGGGGAVGAARGEFLEYAGRRKGELCPLAVYAGLLGYVSGVLSLAIGVTAGSCIEAWTPFGAAALWIGLGLVFVPEIAAGVLAVLAMARISRRGMRGLGVALVGLIMSLLWSGLGLGFLFWATYFY